MPFSFFQLASLPEEASVSVLERRDEYGATPLLLAAYGGQTGVVLLLISAGADKCAADSTGRTAAHLAAMQARRYSPSPPSPTSPPAPPLPPS